MFLAAVANHCWLAVESTVIYNSASSAMQPNYALEAVNFPGGRMMKPELANVASL